MSTLAVGRPLIGPYARVDAAWKNLLATGPKWFMDHVWNTCVHYVRTSNAWPGPADGIHPREAAE